jgi:hypothetical protein
MIEGGCVMFTQDADSRAELVKLEAVRDALADAVTGLPAEGAVLHKLFSRSAERTSTYA